MLTRVCWLFPLTTVMVKPRAFDGTDVDDAVYDPRQSALVGGDAGRDEGIIAGVDCGAAGQEGQGLGRTAIIPEAAAGVGRR